MLELLMVVVLMAMMVVIVPPALSKSSSTEMKLATQKIANALRYTRSQAIATKQASTFDLDVKRRQYRYPGSEHDKPIADSLTIKITSARSEFIDKDTGVIRFYPDGSSTGGKIIVATPQNHKTIRVSWITGKVTVNDQ